MKIFSQFWLAAAVVGASSALPSQALAAPPTLTAKPAAASLSLPAGQTDLGNGAIAYRPANLPAGKRPLVVLLHGNNQKADELIGPFRAEADRRGLILLAPKSSGRTWDLMLSAEKFRDRPPRNGEKPEFGQDIARIDAALNSLFGKAPVDPAKIVLAGFSDGGSYALSLGLPNPRLFSGLIAFAPGSLLAPPQVSLSQRIAIASGRADRVIPIRVVRDLAAPLAAAKLKVQFEEFGGAHKIDERALAKALDFTLAP